MGSQQAGNSRYLGQLLHFAIIRRPFTNENVIATASSTKTTANRRFSGAYIAERRDAPRDTPRLMLNSMESRWLLLENLSRFNANDDTAMGNAIANELEFPIDSTRAVRIAEG